MQKYSTVWEEKMKRKAKLTIGITAMVLSIIAMNCVLYQYTIGLQKYDRTTGVVLEADSVEYQESWRMQYITFSYTYQGKTYTDSENCSLAYPYDPYEVGDKLDICIKPGNPYDYYIDTNSPSSLLGFAIADAAVTVAVIAFLIGIKTGRTKLA